MLAEVEAEGVREIVVGGDVASGPLPRQTVTTLSELGAAARFVMGNADLEILSSADPRTPAGGEQAPDDAAFAARSLESGQLAFIAGFEESVSVEIDGLGPTLFCHGSPRSATEAITTASSAERLRGLLAGVAERVVVCGHTHRQFDRRVDGHRVINAGSVGLPYEGRPGAYWALLGPEVQLRRTEYDVQAALAELRAAGYPDTDELLRESLLEPADPDQVAELFERASGG